MKPFPTLLLQAFVLYLGLVPQIATIAGMNRETTRQILTALEGKLVTAEETMQGKAWRLRGQQQ